MCPEREIQTSDEEKFRRDSLLLLTEIRDYSRRTCEAVEKVLGRHPTDPRDKPTDLYKPRLHPSEK